MRFDYLLIGFLLFTGVILGGTLMLNDLNRNYGDSGVNLSDEDFGEVYNTMDDMYDTSQQAKESALGGDITEQESWSSMTKGSYSAIRLMTGTFKLYTNIANAIASTIGIPQFIIDIGFIILTITIIFGLVYMIFRYSG